MTKPPALLGHKKMFYKQNTLKRNYQLIGKSNIKANDVKDGEGRAVSSKYFRYLRQSRVVFVMILMGHQFEVERCDRRLSHCFLLQVTTI